MQAGHVENTNNNYSSSYSSKNGQTVIGPQSESHQMDEAKNKIWNNSLSIYTTLDHSDRNTVHCQLQAIHSDKPIDSGCFANLSHIPFEAKLSRL